MKRILLIVACSMMFASCGQEFLNLNPQDQLNLEGFYANQTDMNMAVLSAYSGLRDVGLTALGEIRSDNTSYSWLAGNPIDERGIDEFKEPLLETNGYLNGMWNNCYRLILRCNVVLAKNPGATFAQEKLRTQYEAEARFLRAYAYFVLNTVFQGYSADGKLLGVCKVDKLISQAESYDIVRAPLEDIYNLIIEDLTFAAANLPKSYGADDKGRVIQAGAVGMLAKVYMFMAGYPLNKGNEYYTKAIQQMENLFNNYPEVKLVQTYQHLWSSPQNMTLYTKNSTESLFEIQYQKGAPNESTACGWNNDFAPRFDDGTVLASGSGGGSNAPTMNMSNAYEYGDPRKYVSMRDGWKSKAGIWQNDKYVCKYYDKPISGNSNGNNWIVLRLADIYLLYAEALVRTGGDKAKAVDYVNKIRQRARATAGDPAITDAPATLLRDYTVAEFASNDDLLLAIEKERRVELAFEAHRWFDLVRTGRAKACMELQQFDEIGPFTWDPNKLFYPIPEQVMQQNPGKIIQNKGYVQK